VSPYFLILVLASNETRSVYLLSFRTSHIATDSGSDNVHIDFWTLSFISSNYWGGCYVIIAESSYNNAVNSKPWADELTGPLDNVTAHFKPQCLYQYDIMHMIKSNLTAMVHLRLLLNYTESALVVPHINRIQSHAQLRRHSDSFGLEVSNAGVKFSTFS
jgi:hypothetical protein